MFALIACLLCQFQPGKFEPISIEKYSQLCDEQKKIAVDSAVAELERQTTPGQKALLVEKNKLKAQKKQGLEEIKAYETDNSKIHEVPLDFQKLAIGKIGILTVPSFVEHGKVPPMRLTVLQQIGKNELLCEAGESVIFVKGINTDNVVDGEKTEIPLIIVVVGKYSYTNTLGAKKTVFALEPWKHNDEWRALKQKKIEETPKPEIDKKKKPATKKK